MAAKKEDDWDQQLRSTVEEGLKNVREAIKEREALQAEREARINAVRGMILPRLKTVQSLLSGHDFLGGNHPEIEDAGTEVRLVMPRLSEVNHIDLVYSLELKEDLVLLKSYKRIGDGRLEQSGFADRDHEEFVKSSLLSFIKAWFGRRVSDEKDKSRELRLVVEQRGL